MMLLHSRTVVAALMAAAMCLGFARLSAAAKKDKSQSKGATEAAGPSQGDLYGKPMQLDNLNRRGLYIWRTGRAWHVVSAAQGQRHVFTGMVHVKDGKFTNVANFGNMEVGRVPLMYRSHVSDIGTLNAARDTISFKFTTIGARDGFNFTVDDTATEIEFRVLRDGKPIPGEVFVGANGIRPPGAAFSLPANPSRR